MNRAWFVFRENEVPTVFGPERIFSPPPAGPIRAHCPIQSLEGNKYRAQQRANTGLSDTELSQEAYDQKRSAL